MISTFPEEREVEWGSNGTIVWHYCHPNAKPEIDTNMWKLHILVCVILPAPLFSSLLCDIIFSNSPVAPWVWCSKTYSIPANLRPSVGKRFRFLSCIHSRGHPPPLSLSQSTKNSRFNIILISGVEWYSMIKRCISDSSGVLGALLASWNRRSPGLLSTWPSK